MALFNLARMTVSSTGTGAITLNAAVSGFLTFDAAGCSTAATGQPVSYAIGDTTQSEQGSGVYTSSSLSLTRGSSLSGLKSTNSNSPINMTSAAQVIITPQAAGIVGRKVYQFFGASGTYTPTTGLIVADIECIGGGAGGGGVDGFSGAVLTGGGGGSGGYSRSISLSSAIGASQVVTIGAGGAGGIAAAAGSSGGTTSVGAICIAIGGSGGVSAANLQPPVGGAGAVQGTGTINYPGHAGAPGYYSNDVTNPTYVFTAAGGDSLYGQGGGPAMVDSLGTSSANGIVGRFGAGGSGGGTYDANTTVNGGAGGDGFVTIIEFCSL